MASRPRSQKVARLHQHPNGTMHALSSDGRTVYTVRNTAAGSWECSCLGWVNHGHCYHAAGAAQRFGGYFARPAVLAVILPATPEPEPTPPAAPAALRPARRGCRCDLYPPEPGESCDRCAQWAPVAA